MNNLDLDKKNEVIEYVNSKTEISASDLQRKFLWGYNRASHTIEWLYSIGIIGDSNGLCRRKVFKSKQDSNGN